MERRNALLVGLKSVDPSCYGGWDGTAGCWGCELDVDNIARVLEPLEYSIVTLKSQQATRPAILHELGQAAERTRPEDVFLFYFSGHGGQQPDVDGDESDGQDETLVAYCGELVDDQLAPIWQRFPAGARIVMISDSCNSGTNYRLMRDVEGASPVIPVAYDRSTGIQAQMIHLGGCRDGGTSAGYAGGGAFTKALCEVWNSGSFRGTHRQLLSEIASRVAATQRPVYNEFGQVTDAFRNARAFSGTQCNDRDFRAGAVKRVRCTLEFPQRHVAELREAIVRDSSRCLLEALDDALSKERNGSATVSCTGSSSGTVSCTGSLTVNL